MQNPQEASSELSNATKEITQIARTSYINSIFNNSGNSFNTNLQSFWQNVYLNIAEQNMTLNNYRQNISNFDSQEMQSPKLDKKTKQEFLPQDSDKICQNVLQVLSQNRSPSPSDFLENNSPRTSTNLIKTEQVSSLIFQAKNISNL